MSRLPLGLSTPARALASALLVLAGVPGGASAQDASALAVTCAADGGDVAVCRAMAVAAREVGGQIGLGSGFGAEVAGTASNLGQRLGTAPRWAVAVRARHDRVGLPDLSDASGAGGASFAMSSLHVDVAAGLFDGFRIMPTVGGFLSLDLFGRASWLLLSEDRGFDGRVSTVTAGARVGVFRESFTLPGVSVSVARRFSGEVGLGDTTGPARVVVDPATTSVRAIVGKDLFAVELSGGVGWDDYGNDIAWTVTDGVAGSVTGAGSIDTSRRLYFVGASLSLGIVFHLALEGGVAQGFDPVPGYAGAFDPEGSSAFGSFALRLTI